MVELEKTGLTAAALLSAKRASAAVTLPNLRSHRRRDMA
jgi:hypothetical protein